MNWSVPILLLMHNHHLYSQRTFLLRKFYGEGLEVPWGRAYGKEMREIPWGLGVDFLYHRIPNSNFLYLSLAFYSLLFSFIAHITL